MMVPHSLRMISYLHPSIDVYHFFQDTDDADFCQEIFPYWFLYLVQSLSHVWLFVDHLAPLSMEFSRQKYWSRLPFPSSGDLLDRGSNPHLLCLLHWQVDSLPWTRPGYFVTNQKLCTSFKGKERGCKIELKDRSFHFCSKKYVLEYYLSYILNFSFYKI